MPAGIEERFAVCNCLAVRQAARHVTQLYDQCLAPSGLRATQFSILSRLQRGGRISINALAREMVMDRTTLGRNILPLERDGLIVVEKAPADRRSKAIRLTESSGARLRAAARGWAEAQACFEAALGGPRAARLRTLLHAVVSTDLQSSPPVPRTPAS
jgi:DNA-binding MarR family transcriptional regulator